jgi:hypothetical protein
MLGPPIAGIASSDNDKRARPNLAAASTADSPLPSTPFGTDDEIEKDSADRRAGWKGI